MPTPDATTVGAWLIGAAALITALVVTWRFAAALLAAGRRLGHFLDDWFGESARPGAPARPGIPERLTRVEQQVAEVRQQVDAIVHELHPNAGGSLRDAIDRVDVRTARIQPVVQQLADDSGDE